MSSGYMTRVFAGIVLIIKQSFFLGLFLAGNLYGIKGALNVSLTIYWLVGVIGIILAMGPVTAATALKAKKTYAPEWLQSISIIVVIFALTWFEHYVLGVVYLIGAAGMLYRNDQIEELQKEKAGTNTAGGRS